MKYLVKTYKGLIQKYRIYKFAMEIRRIHMVEMEIDRKIGEQRERWYNNIND